MSSDQARSYHSMTFLTGFISRADEDNPGYTELIYQDAVNTWDDWHLIPAARPEFAAPKGKNKFVKIPGRYYGGVDISQAVVNYPLYGCREGTLSFYVANDYGDWLDRYNEITDYLHWHELKVILDDDPGFYYEGTFSVEEWQNTKDYSTLNIKYKLHPYKREVISTGEDWLWDPFDFELGVINDKYHITVTEEYRLTLYNLQERVSPTFNCSTEHIELRFNGKLYNLPSGVSRNPLIVLQPGYNTIDLYGYGTIDINFRGGML